MQQLHWPRNLHTIKVLSFVSLKLILQSDLLRYNMVLMWFPERTLNWLKISTNRQLAAASLPCWAPFHYNCHLVSCCFSIFSENHSEIVGKAGNQMLWDSGKLCGFRVTQSVLHPLVCVRCKVNSAQKCDETLSISPPNQYLYIQHFLCHKHTKKKKTEKALGFICFFFFLRLKSPFLFK